MSKEINTNKTDVVGIVSIVLSFAVFAPAGFVVGLVGAHIAKDKKQDPLLSRIGWIAGLVISLLGILWIVSVLLTGAYKAGN